MSDVSAFLSETWGNLDWTRTTVYLVPVMSALCTTVSIATGVGGAKTWIVGWQIAWYCFHVKETQGLELLVELITVSQIFNVCTFAYHEWRMWVHLGWVGILYGVIMGAMSPVGVHLRLSCDTHTVKTAIAWILTAYVALKCPLPSWDTVASFVRKRANLDQRNDRTIYVESNGKENDMELKACSKKELVDGENEDLSEPEKPEPVKKQTDEEARKDAMDFDMWAHKWPLWGSAVFSGILGGLVGMAGTPLMVFVGEYSVPKFAARPLLPLGLLMELPVRIYVSMQATRMSRILEDLHLLLLNLVFAQVGGYVGNWAAKKMSQETFMYCLFGLCVWSCMVTLGIVYLSLPALGAIVVILAMFTYRICSTRGHQAFGSDSSSDSESAA